MNALGKAKGEIGMTHPTLEEQHDLVRRMTEAHREIDRLRREALRGLPYRWEDVDALLELGNSCDGPPRLTSGLVEMQRIFMKAAPKGMTKGE